MKMHSVITIILGFLLFTTSIVKIKHISSATHSAAAVYLKEIYGCLLGVEVGLIFAATAFVAAGFMQSPDTGFTYPVVFPHFKLVFLLTACLGVSQIIISTLKLVLGTKAGSLGSLGTLCCEIQRLRWETSSDKLTGLYNRRALSEIMTTSVWKRWSVIMIDIDDFKACNDTYGHPIGDRILTKVGRCIAKCIRSTDLAYRYGGEEFLVICPDTFSADSHMVANRIRIAIEGMKGLPRPITVSIGVAFSDDGKSLEESIHAADQALYKAKRLGKNLIAVEVL